MEYWNIGILRTRVWWSEICFYGVAENKKLIQIDIRIKFPVFHHSSIPFFQGLSDGQHHTFGVKSKPGAPGRCSSLYGMLQDRIMCC